MSDLTMAQRLEGMSRRDAAQFKGERRYDPGYLCKRGHASERYTVNSGCIECMTRKMPPRNKPTQIQKPFALWSFISVEMPPEIEAKLETYLVRAIIAYHKHYGLVAPLNEAPIQWAEQTGRPIREYGKPSKTRIG